MAGHNLALTVADLKAELDELLAYYKSLKTDGWSMEDIYSFVTRAVASLVRLVGEYDATTTDLKATVLAAFDELYDKVVAPIDIPYVPERIEARFVDPFLKAALKKQVAGMIDGLVRVFNSTPSLPDLPGVSDPPVASPPPLDNPLDWQPY